MRKLATNVCDSKVARIVRALGLDSVGLRQAQRCPDELERASHDRGFANQTQTQLCKRARPSRRAETLARYCALVRPTSRPAATSPARYAPPATRNTERLR